MSAASDWASAGGVIWAARWRQTDRGLAGIEASLVERIRAAAPDRTFRAFEIGCGAGATTADVAAALPNATIVAADVSADLLEVARQRLASRPSVTFAVGDAELIARDEGPFDLVYSRHGVMFFDDPERAFRTLANAAAAGAKLVFSCFRDWQANTWASELGSAAADQPLPSPGRQAGGFAFADPDYVRQLLSGAGWTAIAAEAVDFTYVAGAGREAVAEALDYLCTIGPASAVLRQMDEAERPAAIARMKSVIERYARDGEVRFPASAWIWSAAAPTD